MFMKFGLALLELLHADKERNGRTDNTRYPLTVFRWERAERSSWLLKGNEYALDTQWLLEVGYMIVCGSWISGPPFIIHS
jgi:hypothetical protein